jgi:DNA-binding NarL/FixJ family response regulator
MTDCIEQPKKEVHRVVICDDHGLFLDGLELLLSQTKAYELVGRASNGKELIDLVEKAQPKFVITDITMPEMDGIEATRQIVNYYPGVVVIGITMSDNIYLLREMLEAGARALLLKNTTAAELTDALRLTGSGYYYLSTTLKQKLPGEIIFPFYRPSTPLPFFTQTELDVMQLICEEYSSKEIAQQLHLSSRTVEAYRERILLKTSSRNSVGIVMYAIREGLYHV